MSINSIIWMGDIEPKMTGQDIINCFLRFNIRPQSVKLIKDKKTNDNKNYCFICFKTVKEANSVLFKLNGKNIPGTKSVFRLNWANCRSSFNKSAYVGNLNPKVDDIKLFNLFKKRYPTVLHASVITENGVSKGYGFVLFNGKEEYEKSLKEMDGINFYGNIIKVKEQKKKNNKKSNVSTIDNEDDSSSSSNMNNSENNYQSKFENINNFININNIINNNSINSSIYNSTPLTNMHYNNKNIKYNMANIDNKINNMINNQINIFKINNKKNIPFTNVNNINNSNKKKYFNYNITKDSIFFSNINNDFEEKLSKKTKFSNNSNVSQNSFNSEQMSNYSTAEKFNIQKKPKIDDLENFKNIDESTLIESIHRSVKKMFNFYQENPFHGDKKIICKF